MTVCVAALCNSGLSIILAADRRIGMGFVEGEMESGKIRFLHQYWRAMIAADEDAAYAFEVVAKAKERLKAQEHPNVADVKHILAESYQQVKNDHVVAKYLPPGWTLEAFNKQGAGSIPELKYIEILTNMQRYDLGIQILVCGFGEWRGEILRVGDRGLVTIQTDSGFDAIGSGDYAAFSTLFQRKYAPSMKEDEALYYVYEAKWAAQRASGVGEETDVLVFNRKRSEVAWDEDLKSLEEIRKQLAPQSLSKEDGLILDKLSVIERARRDENE